MPASYLYATLLIRIKCKNKWVEFLYLPPITKIRSQTPSHTPCTQLTQDPQPPRLSLPKSSKKGPDPPPPHPGEPPIVIHYEKGRYKKLRVQISQKFTNNVPTDTQEWIVHLCHNTISEMISNMSESSKNSLGKSWGTVWIQYHEIVNTAPSIYFHSTTIRSKDPVLSAKGISYNNRRELLDWASFRKLDNYRTTTARNHSLTAHFMLNWTKKYFNIFRTYLQENIMKFHTKAQVWKSKLQSWPEPSKVGYGIYCAKNTQMVDLIKNVLGVIEKENFHHIGIAVHLEEEV